MLSISHLRFGPMLLCAFLLACPGMARAASPQCAAGSITCASVTAHRSGTGWQPVTFGQPFKRGDVPRNHGLAGRDSKGNSLPIQIDEPSTYDDGSLRFAVLSTELPAMSNGEERTINFSLAPLPAPTAPLELQGSNPFRLQVAIDAFSPQITAIRFGDSQEGQPLKPFEAGETVTVTLTSTAAETFHLAIDAKLAGKGAGFGRIASAFADLINSQSKLFTASVQTYHQRPNMVFVQAKSRGKFAVSVSYDGKAAIPVSTYAQVAAPERFVATLPPAAHGTLWLNGPVAREEDVKVPLLSTATGKPHPQLAVRVHLRRYAKSQAVRADVVVENDWAFEPNPGNVTYDVGISRGGDTIFNAKDVTHYHHARWHKLVWSAGSEEPDVVHNIDYFLGSSAVLHYNTRISVQGKASGAASAAEDPMSTGSIVTYMPTTGERADIGPVPAWAANYLLTADPRARAVLFANADAGGTMPMHYRDKATDLPVSLDLHPTVQLDASEDPKANIAPNDRLPQVTLGATPWTVQIAHHPSLFYVPYLLTGDLFYLEEEEFWANWVMGSKRPQLRENAKGLVYKNEVRGQAWSLRTLGEAAVILPDSHPMKRYFNQKLANNIDWYLARYPRNPDKSDVSPLGIIEKPDAHGQSGPWQQDYMYLVVGHLAEQGVPGADELAKWLGKFAVGRWLADEQGFCHQYAPAYYIKIRDADGRFIGTWKDLFQINWPAVTSCPSGFSKPNSAYIAHAYGVLGLAADLGYPGARGAQERLSREVPDLLTNNSAPHFAVVPRS